LSSSRLDAVLTARNSPATSVVVFGSVAREKVTSSSDLDWILLVDRSAVPEHKAQERESERALAAEKVGREDCPYRTKDSKIVLCPA
jgi:predicted nucleotidyltransferase